MSNLSFYKNAQLDVLLDLSIKTMDNLHDCLLISKGRYPENFSEESLFQACLVNVSEKYLPCVNNLVKEHKEAKNLKDPVQLEFVRQILLKDLIPHFKKIYREFLDSSKINDVDMRFADLYMKNLKEQISLLR